MKFRLAFGLGAMLCSIEAIGDPLEYKIMTAVDADSNHQFIYNPALLDPNKKYYSFIALKDTKTSSVVASPNNNRQNISYSLKDDILAAGAMWPFGGGSFGVSYIRANQDLDADNDLISRVITETRRDDIYAMKFIISMTPSLNFGFHYQYKQAAHHLNGSFFVNDDDRTNYKAFLSGYRLGIYYSNQKMGLGLYTAPPTRGKALIDGENKIVAESGTGGLDFKYKLSDKTSLGLGATRWFYRKDDRLELSTSPVDMRNISLNGIDLDQYLAKIQNFRLGVIHRVKPQLSILASLAQQESVFHFNEDGLPGDDRENVPSFRYLQFHIGGMYTKNRFAMELSYHITDREQSSIIDNTQKLGNREYESYSAKETGVIIKVTFKAS
ncbi:hypothetical protein [Pseudobacteriovorax antillogorgiicola]|uniref:Long-chain fatty acid transport protein n=1 Tax=Pseudobacteriovorax antillogorgiicola TaxID=1513793 RepID=A0A1Y6CH30_9BACT|nr:hypothetical protein [Pseudobacteriovorax antillogorgiicola]TCS48610.1 hypothetical protein EDD56_11732 [Pseudobacteriovorax antillogorgiicola]SMF55507.1 hypothetical protein SAMN06296036_117127 [Pseudobacteriovorax antillogorgiicola]